MWRTLVLTARPITCHPCTVSSRTASAPCVPHSGPEGWSTHIVLQDLRGLFHPFCLKANLEFDIALRQAALFDGEVGLVTACTSRPTSSSSSSCCNRGDCRSSFLLSFPLLLLLLLFFLSTPSLFVSLPCRSTCGKRGWSCSSPLNLLIHQRFRGCVG